MIVFLFIRYHVDPRIEAKVSLHVLVSKEEKLIYHDAKQ